MKKLFLRCCVTVAALFIVVKTMPGIQVQDLQTTIVAALVIGLLNAFLRPFLVMLTLPFTILSLGIFTLFINGFIFYIAPRLVKGFVVADFWSAFWAALLFSVISFLLNVLTGAGAMVNVRRRGSTASRPDRGTVIDTEATRED
ncbi:MAG: phage holin family protein [Candidatus Omnitrophota bacterium]